MRGRRSATFRVRWRGGRPVGGADAGWAVTPEVRAVSLLQSVYVCAECLAAAPCGSGASKHPDCRILWLRLSNCGRNLDLSMTMASFALLLLSLCCTRNTFTIAGGLDEEERLGEYYKRGHTWPPKDEEFVPPSDGWRKIMRRRFEQVRRIEDTSDMYNGTFELAIRSHRSKHNPHVGPKINLSRVGFYRSLRAHSSELHRVRLGRHPSTPGEVGKLRRFAPRQKTHSFPFRP